MCTVNLFTLKHRNNGFGSWYASDFAIKYLPCCIRLIHAAGWCLCTSVESQYKEYDYYSILADAIQKVWNFYVVNF